MTIESEPIFNGREFRSMVMESSVISHIFFDEIKKDGPETIAIIKEFARSDYLVAKGFAQFLAHLISLVDDASIRMLLVGNLWDEHGSGNAQDIHFELYKKLLSSLGIEEPAAAIGSRADFLQVHYEIAESSVLDGIAVFTYANEFLSMYEFSKIRAACRRNFPGASELYFQTNQKADVIHTAQLELAMAKLITTESELKSITSAISKALASRSSFYDDVISRARNQ